MEYNLSMERLESFPWPVLKSIVGGASAIDVPRLTLSSIAEAEEFLGCYGFVWSNPDHRNEIESLRTEAIEFLNEELLNDLPHEIEAQVAAENDIRQLLLWASIGAGNTQLWSCALLRVMHTFAHCHSYFNDRYGDEIRRQIFDRFEPHLKMNDAGISLGDIPLDAFDPKPTKPRRSVAMKLMHKAENVAADVFDRLGVRFVTHERFDAIRVVKYLREHNVVMFANIKPSRSRNTLIDIDWLMDTFQSLDAQVASGEVSPNQELDTLRAMVREQSYPDDPSPVNEYSAIHYHSIQFTARQMIRIPDKALGEIRFFFPFEIQILDQESYQQSREGLASHELYKARQREAVQRRILGGLID